MFCQTDKCPSWLKVAPRDELAVYVFGGAVRPSENDANLAQQLAQLQPFIAAFSQERMGQLPSFGPI